MNVHKNARSCPASRELLGKRVCEQGWSVREAAEAAGMSERRGREWLRRWRANEPLTDRSSKPRGGGRTADATRERVLTLRGEWRTIRQIATCVGISASTAARICRAAGVGRLRHVEIPVVPVRYERERPGELLHVDIKRLGQFDRVGIARSARSDRKSRGSSSSPSRSMTSPPAPSSGMLCRGSHSRLASPTSTSWRTSEASPGERRTCDDG